MVSDNGCWIWQGPRQNLGYGRVYFNGKQVYAHRYAAYDSGLLPSMDSPLVVCHSCDNPSCVNPEHLFVGTQRQNMIDKIQKGRSNQATGERVANAKITAADAIAIYNHPETNWSELARSYQVTPQTVYNIRKGRTWFHVTGDQRD